MKTFILGLFATLLFAFNANAQKTVEPMKDGAVVKFISKGKEVTQLKFKKSQELNSSIDAVSGVLDDILKDAQNVDGVCTITIEISVTVTVGLVSTTLTTSITAPCDQVKAAAIKAAKILRDTAMGIVSGR